MDSKKSPDSPDSLPSPVDPHMATMVANNNVANMPQGAVGGINKRYRPAPAKTFQCRGYGECRMVFSRSEHLARHIRKHTGERPFTCHCGKQFSRLDNLRQHAQTVHADKQDQNERMMRDLTSLHATMAAANKVGHTRGGRRPVAGLAHPGNGHSMNLIKQEDLPMSMHQRPGTSTGYEGDHHSLIYQGQNWHVDSSEMDRPDSRPSNNHSFRDPGQSFLAPSSSNSITAAAAQNQSFLPFTSTLAFGLSDSTRDGRPGSSSSRPPTSGGESHTRLPPLTSVVSSALTPSSSLSFPSGNQQQSQQSQQSSQQHILPFPGSLTFRRPSTATRPGTAPASASFFSKSAYNGGSGLVSRPELSIHPYGRSSELGSAHGNYDSELPQSPAGHDSPFYFHPPNLGDSQQQHAAVSSSPPSLNPRKRSFAGADGPYDDGSGRFESAGIDYDYGTESRPQSRRLTVMELCNDPDAAPGSVGAFLLSGAPTDSRPGTSSGLVTSASALALSDRDPRTSPGVISALPARTSTTTNNTNAAGGGAGEEEFGGGGIPSARRGVPPPPATILSRGAPGPSFSHSPTFSTASAPSYSPRSPATSSSFSPRSPLSPSDAAAAFPRRGNGSDDQLDQVRIALSAHPSTAFGMRV